MNITEAEYQKRVEQKRAKRNEQLLNNARTEDYFFQRSILHIAPLSFIAFFSFAITTETVGSNFNLITFLKTWLIWPGGYSIIVVINFFFWQEKCGKWKRTKGKIEYDEDLDR